MKFKNHQTRLIMDALENLMEKRMKEMNRKEKSNPEHDDLMGLEMEIQELVNILEMIDTNTKE